MDIGAEVRIIEVAEASKDADWMTRLAELQSEPTRTANSDRVAGAAAQLFVRRDDGASV